MFIKQLQWLDVSTWSWTKFLQPDDENKQNSICQKHFLNLLVSNVFLKSLAQSCIYFKLLLIFSASKSKNWVNFGSLLTFEFTLKKSELSKSNLWGVLSWQALQFAILIDKIGRPACWPSILSPSQNPITPV